MAEKKRKATFRSAKDELTRQRPVIPDTDQSLSASYRLAFSDFDFLLREELRPVRLQLELLKPELIQRDLGVESTIVVYGSARIPSPEQAKKRFKNARKCS